MVHTQPTPVTHLLYLHGFRSSPRSTKAVQVATHMARHHPGVVWWCPQLPPSPASAWALIQQATAQWPRSTMGVIGSSLGGYYATRVAHDTGCRAVLLNPAVHAARDLARHIGVQTAWHNPKERFFFEPRFVDELAALAVGPLPHPERCLLVAAQGDEVLDWREMVARYPGSPHRVVAGGDHALSGFDTHLPAVLTHLGLPPGPTPG